MKNPLSCWIAGVVLASVSGCAQLSHSSPHRPRVRRGQPNAGPQSGRPPPGAIWMRKRPRRSASRPCALRCRKTRRQARDVANIVLGRFIESNCGERRLRVTEFTGPDGIVYRVRIAAERGGWRGVAAAHELDPIRPVRTRASAPLQWAGWGCRYWSERAGPRETTLRAASGIPAAGCGGCRRAQTRRRVQKRPSTS